MMVYIALLLTCLGFFALALAMPRHYHQVSQQLPAKTTTLLLRVAAVLTLSVVLVLCVLHAGWGIGLVLFFGLLSFAILSVALVLTYWANGVARFSNWRDKMCRIRFSNQCHSKQTTSNHINLGDKS